jgi:periplasmic mercuric ion binding protein
MKFNRFINGIIITVAIVFLVTLAFHVNAKAAIDSVAVLRTTGMTCGSCSSRITEALEKQKGVAVTEVDVEGGWVIVGYDAKTIKPETLATKVHGVGFDSNVQQVLTPEQFKQITGRDIGKNAATSGGCGGCGTKGGGCGSGKPS